MSGNEFLMSGNGSKNILIVEDNRDDAELIKRKFRSSKINLNPNLISVEDGEKALDYLYRRKDYIDKNKFPDPNLIILDVRMPKLNGIEVLRKIKSDKNLKKIPVIMLTVSNLENDIIESFEIGCEHYIAKSVGFSKFEDTVGVIAKHYLSR